MKSRVSEDLISYQLTTYDLDYDLVYC
ncbi:hypothetical protein GQ607_008416 [Colletotrichum asianum]|uniref:Uncharacterized protein n=1 Tax=Colletotrichum asianum TaxID=702518 RepID=A0A8H3WGM3_9PEZI|nr:hypothetical protein GQ607_008416 [Colletotrichum asianum]